MKPLFFIMRKTLKNYIKELKHKPGILILYILIIIIVIAMIIFSVKMPQNSFNFSQNRSDLFGAIVTGLVLFITLSGIKRGITKGSTFFRAADVNFAFTAPISPQKVLIYGFIKQLYATFFIMFFLLFQLPNLKNLFPLINIGGLIIVFTAFLLIFSMSIIGLLAYSIASRNEKIRYYMDKIIYVVGALLIVGFIMTYLKIKTPYDALITFLNSRFFLYIPFVGWFKQVFMAALLGLNASFYINLLLIISFMVLMMFSVYKLNTDYYEDVLQATDLKEQIIRSRKEGKSTFSASQRKLKKVKTKNYGKGAKAIFYRHILEYRKSGMPFIDKGTLFVCIAGIGFGYFLPRTSINAILYFSVYVLFFFVMQGKWAQELSKPYIYLLPFGSATKVFYATLGDLIKHFIDGLILFSISGILLKIDPLSILLCSLVYASFASVFIYGDLSARRFLGATHSKNLEVFLKLLLIFAMIIPDIIITVSISMVFRGNIFLDYYIYLGMLTYNILFSFILLLIGKGLFEKLELN